MEVCKKKGQLRSVNVYANVQKLKLWMTNIYVDRFLDKNRFI